MDDVKLLFSKIADLSRLCLKNCYPAFSKFMDETSLARVSKVKEAGCTYVPFGGYEDAERKIMGCFPEGYYDEDAYNLMFPLCTLKLLPSDTEGLTHRDYLGSLMGLGIARECIGDIVLFPEGAYVICLEDIKDFILSNLDRIGRKSVKIELCENETVPGKTLLRKSVTAASDRLDCIVAQVSACSRNKVDELIREGKIQVNYLQADSTSKKLKPGDVVSVRGFGKFIYVGVSGETKKGRLKIEYDLYN